MMGDVEAIQQSKKYGIATPRPNQVGNTCIYQTDLDTLPDPKNPLEIGPDGRDGLDRIFRCVAVSANTIRDAGYPQETAWHLVLAARHVKSAMDGIERANATGDITGRSNQAPSKKRWDASTENIRCFDKARRGGSVAKVS